MRTNIELDEEKMTQLMELGKFKTKKEAVNQAIEKLIWYLALYEFDKTRNENAWVGNLEKMRTYDKWEDSV